MYKIGLVLPPIAALIEMGALTGERSVEVSTAGEVGRPGLDEPGGERIVPTAVLREMYLGRRRKDDWPGIIRKPVRQNHWSATTRYSPDQTRGSPYFTPRLYVAQNEISLPDCPPRIRCLPIPDVILSLCRASAYPLLGGFVSLLISESPADRCPSILNESTGCPIRVLSKPISIHSMHVI